MLAHGSGTQHKVTEHQLIIFKQLLNKAQCTLPVLAGDCSAEGMDVSTAWNGAQPAAFSMGMTAGSDPAANAAAAAALRRHCGCAAMEGV